jgi:hypothetical protein
MIPRRVFDLSKLPSNRERNAMNQKFECIEKHLYRRQYQTAGGDWSTLYYVIFTDWKKKRRTFPVGSDLKNARNECKAFEATNIRREDSDAEKAEKAKGLTYSEWAKIYFKEKVDLEKRASGVDREHRSSKKLESFLDLSCCQTSTAANKRVPN